MKPLGTAALIRTLSLLRPGTALASPVAATKVALRSLARRHIALAEEIKGLDVALAELTATAEPVCWPRPVWAPRWRVNSWSPRAIIPSGCVQRRRLRTWPALLPSQPPPDAPRGHRLNRGGDRAANKALHTIALVRLK